MELVPPNKRKGCLLWQAALRAGREGIACPIKDLACGACIYHHLIDENSMPIMQRKAQTRAAKLALARNRRRIYTQSRSTGIGPGRPGTQPGFSVHTCHAFLRHAYQRLYQRIRKDTSNFTLPKPDRFSVAQFIVANEDRIMEAGLGWRPPKSIVYTAQGSGLKITLTLRPNGGRVSKAKPEALAAVAKLRKAR